MKKKAGGNREIFLGARAGRGSRPAPAGADARGTPFLGAPPGRLEKCFPYAVVLLCCALYALQLGVQTPAFAFQTTGEQVFSYENCDVESSATYAFAGGSEALVFIPEGKASSAYAGFFGSGAADGVAIGSVGSGAVNITKLVVNGKEACSPCETGKEYALHPPAGGRLDVLVEAQEKERGSRGAEGLAFFTQQEISSIEAPVLLHFSGGWSAGTNSAMPSSFYGVDAPFHISKLKEVANGLKQLRFSIWQYPSLSALPGALIYMTIAQPEEYAYKVQEILLFFVPVAVYFAFSRKLSGWRGAAFMFASLIYLYLPAMGYPTGGGADLFMYGMGAQMLATCLSLAFFFFAYGAVFGRKGTDAALAAAFFFLSCAANMRILFSLVLMLAVLCASALAMARARRAIALSAACLIAVSWLYAAFSRTVDVASYGVLEGAAISGPLDGLLAFLQAGYYVLPVLFAAGVYASYRRKELFALLLAACAVAVLMAATSPGMNRAFPFLDGIRFLPSFFLPAFFVSGIGACYLFGKFLEGAEALSQRLRMDRTTLAVALALALLVPFAIFFQAAMGATSGQYSAPARSLAAAAEYSWLERAFQEAGNSTVIYVSGGHVSQYPLFGWREGPVLVTGYGGADALYRKAAERGAARVMIGNRWALGNESQEGLAAAYAELEKDPRFTEIIGFGAGRMLIVNLNGSGNPGSSGNPVNSGRAG